MTYGGHFDILGKKDRIKELENISMGPDFWSDRDSAQNIIDEMNSLKEIVNMVESLLNNVDSDLELSELLLETNDGELLHNL